MDEAPITEQDPEPEAQAAEVAGVGPEPTTVEPVEEAVEPEPASDEPAAEPASDEPASDEPASDEPEPDQLSLDAMVESLKEPEADAVEGTPEASEDAPEAAQEPATGTVPAIEPPAPLAGGLTRDLLAARLPFGIYLGAWVAFVGVMTYLLWSAASAPFTDLPLYAYFVLGGVALTVVGPLLGLVTWLALRSREDDHAGLARAVFMRAAAATLAGDLVWWLGLVLLDLHRTGVLG